MEEKIKTKINTVLTIKIIFKNYVRSHIVQRKKKYLERNYRAVKESLLYLCKGLGPLTLVIQLPLGPGCWSRENSIIDETQGWGQTASWLGTCLLLRS